MSSMAAPNPSPALVRFVLAVTLSVAFFACGKDPVEPCLSTWTKRTAPAPCRSETLCAAATAAPSRKVSFSIDLQASSTTRGNDGTFAELPSAQRKEMWTCLSETLKQRGVKTIDPYVELFAAVNIEGTWADVSDLLIYENVLGIDPGCSSPNVCTECNSLAASACGKDPFCETIMAAPFNDTRTCVSSPLPVGCRVPSGCDAAISFAQDPQGKCWQFSAGCFPAGWTEARQSCSPNLGHLPACM